MYASKALNFEKMIHIKIQIVVKITYLITEWRCTFVDGLYKCTAVQC